jgi:hypothetical protein
MRRSLKPRNSLLRDYKEEITVIVMMMKMAVTMARKEMETMGMKKWRNNLMNLIEIGSKTLLRIPIRFQLPN